jgi:phage terminase large subunit
MAVSDKLPLVDMLQVRLTAFKRKLFDFITDIDGRRNEKQFEALRILTDDVTEEFLYGGAAGGGKSWLGVTWLMFMCLLFPGTAWFIGREELKRLRGSTLLTFFKAAARYGLKAGPDFRYDAQDHIIYFPNGSRIDLLDLQYKPSDPLYERFGSTEYTGGMIEEGGEVNFGAYDVLRTRIGRQLNEKYGLIGKLFITANPKKNWLYTTFYLPAKKGILVATQRYLSALVQDNPHIDKGYISRLEKIRDKATKERLLKGNWDYDDDPTAMCMYDRIIAIFANNHVRKTGRRYLIADIARFGSDKARICVFDGWVLIDHKSFDISRTTEIQACILAMRVKHAIPNDDCIADEDGVGGGVVDNCEINGFVNNASPIPLEESYENGTKKQKSEYEENYQNIQTQCIYGLAKVINANGFYIEAEMSEQDREDICTELSWMKTYKVDDERKLRALPKEVIKENISRSPDWRDVFLMRYWFDIRPVKKAREFFAG